MADAAGQAEVRTQRGANTGVVVVQATVEGHRGELAVPSRILPGSLWHLDVQPHDTVLLVGAGYRLRSGSRDAHGNFVDTVPSFVVDSPFVSLDPTGLVQALEYGRVHMTARTGGDTLTIRVSVVPALTLAGIAPAAPPTGPAKLVAFDTEGKELRTIIDQLSDIGECLDWSPVQQRFALSAARSTAPPYNSVDIVQVNWVGAVLAPIFPPNALPSGRRRFAQYGRSREWIYFSVASGDYGREELWRVRTDGSETEQLTQSPNNYQSDLYPSPSPDGSRVVFATDRRDPNSGYYFELAYLDLASQQVTATDHRGLVPRWSPDGNRIAWLDGTSVRILDLATSSVEALPVDGGSSLDWSADGRWLVTNAGEALYDAHSVPACCVVLIDVDARRVIPIPGTQNGQAVPLGFGLPVFAP